MNVALHVCRGPVRVANGFLTILLGLLSLTALPVAAGEVAERPGLRRDSALLRYDLGLGTTVEGDGAGGLWVSLGDELLLELELGLLHHEDPLGPTSSEELLSARAGIQPDDYALAQTPFSEGQQGGRRGRGGDDDDDGRIDEDPIDGLDNDGDGAVDEDFAAIGASMRVSLANLGRRGSEELRLRSEFYWWPYYHVDRILFWNAAIERADGTQPSPSRKLGRELSLRLRSTLPLRMERRRLRPHVSVGGGAEREVTLSSVRMELDSGERRYVGVLRLDTVSTQIDALESRFRWPLEAAASWPLAVLVARTEETLAFLAGQALLTFERSPGSPENEEHWAVPPLCARCQDPRVGRMLIRLREHEDQLAVTVDYEGLTRGQRPTHEGLELSDIILAPWLERSDRTTALYQIDRDSPVARALIDAGIGQAIEPRVRMISGIEASVSEIDLEIDEKLRTRRVERSSEPSLDGLPGYLSARLVDSWPNPFQQSTIIRYEVPATVERAFDLDETLRARLDPRAAPPFGGNPLVRVKVYNVGGQLIRVLDEESRGPGEYSVSWDGTDVQGRPVAAGAYYVNVEMGEWSVTRRVLRLKP